MDLGAERQFVVEGSGVVKVRSEIWYCIEDRPEEITALVTGTCILNEILNIHAAPIKASEFFCGTLVIITASLPLFLVLDEDASWLLMRCLSAFWEKPARRVVVYYVSHDDKMEGVDTCGDRAHCSAVCGSSGFGLHVCNIV
jgi:fructoselysine-6-P-deglycase FrlB-like protein